MHARATYEGERCGSASTGTNASASEPSVSIIVTNYNYARFLPFALESAVRQRADEVVVVDGGSTDGSREVIAKFGSAVTPVFKEKGCHASAINAGFARSTGEVVLLLDADDVLLHGCVGAVRSAWRPGISKIQWGQYGIDKDGARTGHLYPSFTLKHTPDWCRREMARQCWYDTPPTSGNAWSREFLSSVGPLPVLGSPMWAPDDYLHLLAPYFGDVVSLTEPYSVYRIHQGQLSRHGQFSLQRHANVTSDEMLRYEAVSRVLAGIGQEPLDPLKWSQHTLNRIFARKLGLTQEPLAPLLARHLRAVARSDTGIASKLKNSVLGLLLAVSGKSTAERLARMKYEL